MVLLNIARKILTRVFLIELSEEPLRKTEPQQTELRSKTDQAYAPDFTETPY